MYICLCKGITESQVQKLGQAGFIAAEELISMLGIDDDGCCGRCIGNIDLFLALAAGEGSRVVKCPDRDQVRT